MKKIKKGDEVIVIAGKDKGKKGKVLLLLNDGERLLVEGIRVVNKTVKPDPNKGESSGFKQIELPIHRSNLMLVDPQSGTGSRVGIRTTENGQRVRYYKKSNQLVDVK